MQKQPARYHVVSFRKRIFTDVQSEEPNFCVGPQRSEPGECHGTSTEIATGNL
jgi:hypothetical protein